ncbi:MAG TPA: DUF2203 domain-containing protein [Thermoanaerobaculia bacterium]|nr:DUF2203 domain-containing protein [Thermoanaerobaculia bacterium]
MSGTRRKMFTFEEARALLPEVRERTRRAVEALSELATPSDEAPEAAGTRTERAVAETLAAWANAIEELGIEVKGPWLVDFDSGAGYYCWKWPEESLEFFHGYEEGFAGRVRLQ